VTIEIHEPEVEALINARLQSGGYATPEDVILAALRATSEAEDNARGADAAEAVWKQPSISCEMTYLVENAEALEKYPGEWLLIRGRELLAHSRDFAVVEAAIRENGIACPFTYYVPLPEESNAAFI
jgi:Family of unknown function (DUF5678)